MEDELDASQDGHAEFKSLMKDESFRHLVGCLATMYYVYNRKGKAIDQRSFRTAKEAVTTFCARSSGYSAKLSRDARNGSWRRGEVHPSGSEQGWKETPDVGRLGGRGGRVRSEQLPAADTPSAVPEEAAVMRPADKSRCPGCQARASHVWRMQLGADAVVVCPACVRRKTAASKNGGSP